MSRADDSSVYPASTGLRQPLLARIKALPGVVHAAASTESPLDGGAESKFELAGKAQDRAWRTGNVRNRGLRAPSEPEVWIPSTIASARLQRLIVRTPQDPSTLTSLVRREVSAIDAGVPLISPGRLQDFVHQGLYAGPKFGFLLQPCSDASDSFW